MQLNLTFYSIRTQGSSANQISVINLLQGVLRSIIRMNSCQYQLMNDTLDRTELNDSNTRE